MCKPRGSCEYRPGISKGAFVALYLALATPALAIECPLDHIIFQDAKSGSRFITQRVATEHLYVCGQGSITSSKPRQDLEEQCRGPFGTTIIEGTIDGMQAIAVYEVIPASPCCTWTSYASVDQSDRVAYLNKWLRTERLRTADVPRIELGDERWTIERNPSLPFIPVGGPLEGGSFVPTSCRS